MKEHYVLAIDVAKGKSMISLISSCGEVLINPYEINHKLNDFKNLDERIKKLNVFNDTIVIMGSTGIYQILFLPKLKIIFFTYFLLFYPIFTLKYQLKF